MFPKKYIWISIIVIIVIIGGGSGVLYAKTIITTHTKVPVKMEGAKVIVKSSNGKKQAISNPFGDAKTPTEHMIQEYIHGMSHQKVKADEKWVLYKITPERIQYLINVVKSYPFVHKDLYLSILNRWKHGDFSQAVEDHNAIWSLEGGTVGKAERRLTPAEERRELATKNYN